MTRVAIVTGASGGIGYAVATQLAKDGMTVLVHYSGNKVRADQIVSEITEAGGTASAFQADVAESSQISALFDEVERLYGGVDVVVNTAAISSTAALADLNLDDLDRMHRINIRGTFVVSQQAARRLRPGGALINFSSTVVRLGTPTYTAYVASKGAVEAMTLALAKEMRGRDVTVNTVAPGATVTPMFLEGRTQEAIDAATQAPPLGRIGTPADVASVVAFLAGPARWINGQVIRVNGGVAA
ncbi:SDR family oxidoreductase [Kibdelosporangium philippinense]|uniref:SDR family oxidoreductase n=1 Tax=Kibdelosporangium philippinense TaxID=211113 RepID=A0ABS8Z8L8_9PSEU|nr:SDR family oxidoreductase [Kibdelosporangium philippinense]MCE7003742.1 SDR family oxidoreductase [Kibdelosporangium philippinense]